jgi:hypothetical protein
MALVWNTRQLLNSSPTEPKRDAPTPVEFHFLSRRELYDNTIITADRHHSSAGEWVIFGDHRWYSVSVVTRPTYALPQELCLSFDCFTKEERIGTSTSVGPPIDEVALEFGALLSLLVREPLFPIGTRRISGKPFKFENRYGQVFRPPPAEALRPKGVNSTDLRRILCGLASADEKNSSAILAASSLYHAALSLSAYDISTAYFLLVSAVECLSGHHLKEKRFAFADVEKFKKAGALITQIESQIGDHSLTDDLKCAILREEHFVWQKFRDFIEEFLPEEFWLHDELFPEGYATPAIEKAALRHFLGEAYKARSAFAHSGVPFPAHVELGISDRVGWRTMMEGLALKESARKP